MRVVLVLGLLGFTSIQAQPVMIDDPGLDAAIREELDWWSEPLTTEVMAQLLVLPASRYGIASLNGLDAAGNLVELDASFNQLHALPLPAGLTNLETLNLRGNQLVSLDIPAVAPQLRRMSRLSIRVR